MSKELTYLDAIREALAEEMRRDPHVFVLGEDVGVYGGAFGVTQGFHGVRRAARHRHADLRVGDRRRQHRRVAGGFRPVAEMQFADFISCGFDQIVNGAAARYRSGPPRCRLSSAAPSGGGVGGGPYHSQNPEAWFMHRPGLKVVARRRHTTPRGC